jgi:fibronectin-binding autotransporter adhesin
MSTTFTSLTANVFGNTVNIVSTGGTNGTDNIINLAGAAGFINQSIFFNGADFAARNSTNGYVRALAYGSDANTAAVNTLTANQHVKLTSTPGGQNSIALLSLNLVGSTNFTLNASQSLTFPTGGTAAIIKSGGGSSTISGGTSIIVPANTELVVRTNTSTDTLTISTPIPLANPNSLVKSGEGILILSAANVFNGTPGCAVNGGVLRLNHATALRGGIGATGGQVPLVINGGVVELTTASGNFSRNFGTASSQVSILGGASGFSAFGGARTVNFNNDAHEIQWDGANFTPTTLVLNAFTADSKLTLANAIDLNAATRTVAVNANTAEISGVIRTASGTAGLTKTGVGTLVLSNTNTYNGSTLISDGVLQIGNAGTLGTLGSGAVIDNASLIFNRTNGYTVANDIGGAGSVTQAGSGTTIFTGANSYDTTLISAGTLQIGNGSSTGTLGSGPVVDNASLVFNRNNSYTVPNAISGSGTLTQSGTGTTILTGTNSYLGATNVSAGTLLVNGNNSAATGAVTVALGGTLGGSGGIVGGATTVQNGGKLSPGASIGLLTIDDSLNILGAVTPVNSQSMIFELGTNPTGDKVVLTGSNVLTIALPGPGVLEFDDFLFTGTPTAGVYTLFDTGAPINGLLGTNLSGTIGGFSAALSFANSNNDLVLTLSEAVENVPEPSTLGLAATGLVGAGICAWRRRKRA